MIRTQICLVLLFLTLNGITAQSGKLTDEAINQRVEELRSGLYGDFEEIVFATRSLNKSDGHWYANFGYYCTGPE